MLLSLFAIIAGLAVLIWSADYFVEGAAATAAHFGISPFVIGLTIIGFGTSAPELLISGISAYQGAADIAVGNAIGSNFANVALILGITAIIAPIAVPDSVVKKEFPLLIGVSLITAFLLYDLHLSQIDAIILLLLFIASMTYLTLSGGEPDDNEIPDENIKKAIFQTLVGIVLLSVSSKILVWGAVTIAESLGVSQLIIGLTILAIGTSLPELAASVASAKKGHSEMALGNVIGSNLFNTLAVLAVAGLVQATDVASDVLHRDLPLMLGITIIAFLIAKFRSQFSRMSGYGLTACFVTYMLALVWISL